MHLNDLGMDEMFESKINNKLQLRKNRLKEMMHSKETNITNNNKYHLTKNEVEPLSSFVDRINLIPIPEEKKLNIYGFLNLLESFDKDFILDFYFDDSLNELCKFYGLLLIKQYLSYIIDENKETDVIHLLFGNKKSLYNVIANMLLEKNSEVLIESSWVLINITSLVYNQFILKRHQINNDINMDKDTDYEELLCTKEILEKLNSFYFYVTEKVNHISVFSEESYYYESNSLTKLLVENAFYLFSNYICFRQVKINYTIIFPNIFSLTFNLIKFEEYSNGCLMFLLWVTKMFKDDHSIINKLVEFKDICINEMIKYYSTHNFTEGLLNGRLYQVLQILNSITDHIYTNQIHDNSNYIITNQEIDIILNILETSIKSLSIKIYNLIKLNSKERNNNNNNLKCNYKIQTNLNYIDQIIYEILCIITNVSNGNSNDTEVSLFYLSLFTRITFFLNLITF